MTENIWNDENIVKVLKNNGVVIMPTDTIYGMVGKVDLSQAVDKILKLKKRSPDKKFITLIADWDETKKLGIDSSLYIIPDYDKPTTIIIEDTSFRVPMNEALRALLRKTGPLLAPSANPEGEPPAETIKQAKNYFGDKIDLYVDGGTIIGKASKLIRLRKDGTTEVLRP